MTPVKIFLSYSHKDEEFKDELLEFLSPMQGAGEIEVWNDRAIVVGDEWNEEIAKALEEAHLVLFLISPSFLASSYINKKEIKRAMERHQQDRIRLVPVMIRTCDINSHVVQGEQYKISDFQGVPTNMKPINNWSPRDDGWMNVINGLKPAISRMKQRQQAS